ncbi:hypothetical protein D9599_03580 [Roseomonas sp. KE2513]|uniref:hypothetical protein n=1 Tax=Roseomonas sp. KE2513 TaxID=2479202 RepID=UPI0018E04881|nr:hypothetical protein [Roseomonas sp. KE2513]MBI0534649.1 hypothetical protein [Roseomonas sp. KE2513]
MDKRLIKAVQLMSKIGREDLSEEQQSLAFRGYFDILEQVSTDPAAAGEDQQLAREILHEARQYSLMHTAEAVEILANLAKEAEDPAVRADAKASLAQAAEALRQRGEDISKRIAQPNGKPS